MTAPVQTEFSNKHLYATEKQNKAFLEKAKDVRLKTDDPHEFQQLMHPEKEGSSKQSVLDLAKHEGMFLRLFMEQLKAQTPDKPVDSAEMTRTLAATFQAQATIAQNKKMDAMAAEYAKSGFYASMNMLGNEVEIQSNNVELKNGKAEFSYDIPKGSEFESVKYILKDHDGNVIRESKARDDFGWNTFVWNGSDDQDVQRKDGLYNVHVIGIDPEGKSTELEVRTTGTVLGAKRENNRTFLSVGDQDLFLENVTKIKKGSDAIYQPHAALPVGNEETTDKNSDFKEEMKAFLRKTREDRDHLIAQAKKQVDSVRSKGKSKLEALGQKFIKTGRK